MASNKTCIKFDLTRRCMKLKGESVFNTKPLVSTTEAGVGKMSSRAADNFENSVSSDDVPGVDRHKLPNNESNKVSIASTGISKACRTIGLGHSTRTEASA